MRRPRQTMWGRMLAPLFTFALTGALAPPAAHAQAAGSGTPPAAAAASAPVERGGTVENDPIRCWNRASAGAVRIGETFTVTLTCAVIETELVKVLPDETKLGVTVIQMTPFEVAGGDHPADIRTNSRRFFQYSYNIRMINPDAIGTDVPIPLQQVSYRINSTIAGNQQQQGREMSYVLPVLWVKVLSTVPQDATDIRDTQEASFNRIEQIAFRAGALEIVGTTLIVLGGVMTLLGLIAIARRAARRVKGPQVRMLSPFSIMNLAVREIGRAQQDASGSWNDAGLNRAIAGLRIAAAGALDRPVSQRFVEGDAEAGDGRFIVSRLGRGRKVAVSASITGLDLERALAKLPADAPKRHLLTELKETLDGLAAARYSRPGGDRGSIDALVNKAQELARTVRGLHVWPRPWLRRMLARTPLVQQKA